MGLREQVRVGSFREKRFTTMEATTEGLARRIQLHEFPFRDRPFAEDFGQQTPTFSFTAHVAWEDRDAFIKACQEKGPGRLVHPIWGERTVVCTSCETTESVRHVGRTFLNLTFVVAGDNVEPSVTQNTGAQVGLAVKNARPLVVGSFETAFPRNAPQWVTDASIARVDDLTTALNRARALVPGQFNLATFQQVLLELRNPAALVSQPSLLGSTISRAIQRLTGLSIDPVAAFRMLEGFVSDFGSTFALISAPSGTSRALEAQRQVALVRLSRSSAVVESGLAVRSIPLTSYNDAAALRERVVTLFDGELDAAGETGDDGTLRALESVRTTVLADLRERGGDLARVRSVKLPVTTPAVVLAYRLYSDPDRGEEIVTRNRLRHPMFLPAAQPLEVLGA